MTIRIITGDCRDMLATLPDASVQCCVTSPPYFGLRDYGMATWEGGDPACGHKQPVGQRMDVGRAHVDGFNGSAKESTLAEKSYVGICGKCGAVRVDSQIGMEPTPDAYVAEMVAVFREVRRVLRNDGTLWLNIGDSYVGSANNGGVETKTMRGTQAATGSNLPTKRGSGLKPKDLIGIPWMLAFALRSDGWYLRQEIIWHKPNPMPESVTDRCTKAHESVFLLTKAPRYYYDADAIAEPAIYGTDLGLLRGRQSTSDANVAWTAPSIAKRQAAGIDSRHAGSGTRNRRSVWTIASQPFAESHFATMPPDLARDCILAGTSERGQCPHCGSPWARQLSKEPMVARSDRVHDLGRTRSSGTMVSPPRSETTGWAPTCTCPIHFPVPQTVLDPFGGAGTTALASDRLQRDCTLIELNPAYAEMAQRRIAWDAGMFGQVE